MNDTKTQVDIVKIIQNRIIQLKEELSTDYMSTSYYESREFRLKELEDLLLIINQN